MKTYKEFMLEVVSQQEDETEEKKLTPKEKSLLKKIIEKQKKQPKQKEQKPKIEVKKQKPESNDQETTTKVTTPAPEKKNPESGGISNYSARPNSGGVLMTWNRKPMEEQSKGYIPKDLHRRAMQHIRQGLNPDNPSRMNTNLQFKDPQQQVPNVERKIQPFVPDENLPPKMNPSSKKGRLLKNVLPGGKVA